MRCSRDCEDRVKDSMPGGDAAKADMSALQSQFESCITKCADTHCELIPQMKKRMEATLKKY